ncbi:hypothetical protein DQ04_26291000, partial [Trypanosoma grayi]|uniref:hypothetical protein n=1 Tax=Trypanosoma grayi TaxID=71804 RepID=UPI0004F42794
WVAWRPRSCWTLGFPQGTGARKPTPIGHAKRNAQRATQARLALRAVGRLAVNNGAASGLPPAVSMRSFGAGEGVISCHAARVYLARRAAIPTAASRTGEMRQCEGEPELSPPSRAMLESLSLAFQRLVMLGRWVGGLGSWLRTWC